MKKLTILIILITLAGFVFSQSVEIKDSADNPLITINDEGTTGSITLPSGGALGTSDNKLYNNSGALYWSGSAVNTGSGGGYSVGDFVHGGIVFWLDETGEHGLVCAKTDQSPGIRWYSSIHGNTRARGDGPFSGEMNTSIIIAALVAIGDTGSPYAARLCAELQVTEGSNTYRDWYLPSLAELHLMYQNKGTIDAVASGNGGNAFTIDYYWSSTEYDNNNAWVEDFLTGSSYLRDKLNTDYVRAIRAF